MRNRFDEQLELLNVELIRMGALCEDAISYASRTLMKEGDFSDEAVSYTHLIQRCATRLRLQEHFPAPARLWPMPRL